MSWLSDQEVKALEYSAENGNSGKQIFLHFQKTFPTFRSKPIDRTTFVLFSIYTLDKSLAL